MKSLELARIYAGMPRMAVGSDGNQGGRGFGRAVTHWYIVSFQQLCVYSSTAYSLCWESITSKLWDKKEEPRIVSLAFPKEFLKVSHYEK